MRLSGGFQFCIFSFRFPWYCYGTDFDKYACISVALIVATRQALAYRFMQRAWWLPLGVQIGTHQGILRPEVITQVFGLLRTSQQA